MTLSSSARIRGLEPRADQHLRDSAIQFGRFRVVPGARQLFADGRPVELGSRAFDLLMVLLNARGTVVAKEVIFAQVWPSTAVDECNLRFQMASLRKVLGSDRDLIKTVPGRGYILATEMGNPPMNRDIPLPVLPRPAPLTESPLIATSQRLQTTVVVIEDDREVREALRNFLRSTGLHVEVFASVEAFKDSDLTGPPGCLVLDVWLPGQSGLEFQADLAERKVNLPLVFISGHADIPM